MALTIYEAVNRTRKELLIGAGAEPLAALRARHASVRPPELAGWDFAADDIEYREVERGISERDAPAFLEGYARSVRRAGWVMKVTRDGWLVAKG